MTDAAPVSPTPSLSAQPVQNSPKPHLKLQPQRPPKPQPTPNPTVTQTPRQSFRPNRHTQQQSRKPALDTKPGPASAPFLAPTSPPPPLPIPLTKDTPDHPLTSPPATKDPSTHPDLPIIPARPAQPAASPSPPPPSSTASPSARTSLSSPRPRAAPAVRGTPGDGNACDRLISVARTLRAKPVYTIRRVGGEDHCPLFHAVLELHPQGYRTEGMGGSKLISRRSAASSMLQFVVALASRNGAPNPDLPGADEPFDVEKGEKLAQLEKVEKEKEEEGEIVPERDHALFYVDRQPDPSLKKEVEAATNTPQTRTQVQTKTLSPPSPPLPPPPKASEEIMINGMDVDEVKIPRKKGLPPLRVAAPERFKPSGSPVKRHKPPSVKSPRPIPVSRPNPAKPTAKQSSPPTPPKQKPLPEPTQTKTTRVPPSPKRPRHPDPEYNIPHEHNKSYVPPRKRAKALKELLVRQTLWLFADWRDAPSKKALHSLVEAGLFIQLSAFVMADVVSEQYPVLKDAVLDVTAISKERADVAGCTEAALAFAAGSACERIWVLRAKHLAKNAPASLSPRIIILRDDECFKLLEQAGVLDVVKPTNLVEFVSQILQTAVEDL